MNENEVQLIADLQAKIDILKQRAMEYGRVDTDGKEEELFKSMNEASSELEGMIKELLKIPRVEDSSYWARAGEYRNIARNRAITSFKDGLKYREGIELETDEGTSLIGPGQRQCNFCGGKSHFYSARVSHHLNCIMVLKSSRRT